jgi:hypothetical protein
VSAILFFFWTFSNNFKERHKFPFQQAGVAAINALVFGAYGYFIDLQQRHSIFPSTHEPKQPSLINVFIAGAAAGSVTR